MSIRPLLLALGLLNPSILPAGRPAEELQPKSETSFFTKGYRGEKIFARDENGRVDRLIDRRDNNDLVWKRVPDR